jgi:hypothetical protein
MIHSTGIYLQTVQKETKLIHRIGSQNNDYTWGNRLEVVLRTCRSNVSLIWKGIKLFTFNLFFLNILFR